MRALLFILFALATSLAGSELDSLPVLHQGRIKPLAVAAEESLYAIAGTSRLPGADSPSATMLSIMRDPEAWMDKPLVYVPWLALRPKLGIALSEQRASLTQVEAIRPLLQAVVSKKQRIDNTGVLEPWSADDEATYTLANRFAEALAVVGGQTIFLTQLAVDDAERTWVITTLAPKITEGDRPWRAAVQEIMAKPEAQAARLAEKDIWLNFQDIVRAPDPLLVDVPPGLAAILKDPLNAAVLQARGQRPSAALIQAELIYQRSHPFTIAWIGFILGGILIAIGLRDRQWLYRSGLILTWIAISATVAGLAVRTAITGLAAVTNLFETLIYVGLIVAVLGLYFTRLSGKALYAVAGGIGAGICAMIGEAMPPDLGSHIGQLQPVLRSKFWLWIHVKVVVGAYAPLVLALVLGNLVLWKAWRERRKVTAEESRNLYRCLQWGTVLMAAGTLLGAVWADEAWGRFWGWDPKEVGALMIILTYLIPLHLRYVGVVGPTGIAGWSVLGFLSVIWSWYGVNFLLGAGLHAYAFGTGGKGIILPLAAAQVVLTTWQLLAIRRATAKAAQSQALNSSNG